MLKSELQPPL